MELTEEDETAKKILHIQKKLHVSVTNSFHLIKNSKVKEDIKRMEKFGLQIKSISSES